MTHRPFFLVFLQREPHRPNRAMRLPLHLNAAFRDSIPPASLRQWSRRKNTQYFRKNCQYFRIFYRYFRKNTQYFRKTGLYDYGKGHVFHQTVP